MSPKSNLSTFSNLKFLIGQLFDYSVPDNQPYYYVPGNQPNCYDSYDMNQFGNFRKILKKLENVRQKSSSWKACSLHLDHARVNSINFRYLFLCMMFFLYFYIFVKKEVCVVKN